jgi:hypothetical protein
MAREFNSAAIRPRIWIGPGLWRNSKFEEDPGNQRRIEMNQFGIRQLAISSALLVLVALPWTSAQARPCSAVQTDLNAQYRLLSTYQSQYNVERYRDRKQTLARYINNVNYSIRLLRAERCSTSAVNPRQPPKPVIKQPPVKNPPKKNCGSGSVVGLDGELICR